MAERIMYVQLKTGYDSDRGPAWIALVSFSKSWRTLTFHGRRLRRVARMAFANADANFYDVETGDRYWVSGPRRDRRDGRHSSLQPVVDEEARAAYEAFLGGSPLLDRDRG